MTAGRRVKSLIGTIAAALLVWIVVSPSLRYVQTRNLLRDGPADGVELIQQLLWPAWLWRPIEGDWSQPLRPIETVRVSLQHARGATASDWPERLAAISTLRELDVSRGAFTEAEALRLIEAEPDSLEVLFLIRSDVGDRTLEALAGLESLQRLHISETLVTEDGIDRLRSARPEMKIIADPLTRRGLGELRRRTRVDLDATRRRIVGLTLPHDATAEEAASLARLPGPIWVGVHPQRIDRLVDLAKLPNLRRLDLTHHAHHALTPEHFEPFAESTSLQELTLNYSTIADEHLPHIAAIKSLRGVDLVETLVTEDGLRRLREQRPDLVIRSQIITKRAWIGSTVARMIFVPEPRWHGPNPAEIAPQPSP